MKAVFLSWFTAFPCPINSVLEPFYFILEVCQNAHLLFFTHKAPTFTSWGFVIT